MVILTVPVGPTDLCPLQWAMALRKLVAWTPRCKYVFLDCGNRFVVDRSGSTVWPKVAAGGVFLAERNQLLPKPGQTD